MEVGGSSAGRKVVEHVADHSLPFSAEVKNAWAFTRLTPS
jgi:predicted ATP-dependent serine protease